MITTKNPFIAQLFARLEDLGWQLIDMQVIGSFKGDPLCLVWCHAKTGTSRTFLICDQGERGYATFLSVNEASPFHDAEALDRLW